MWYEGVETYDISKKKNFRMFASLLWTISDFPAYAMLSGWSMAGRLTCPYCMEETRAFSLRHEKKISWFDCHRCFLQINHPFRKDKKTLQVIELRPAVRSSVGLGAGRWEPKDCVRAGSNPSAKPSVGVSTLSIRVRRLNKSGVDTRRGVYLSEYQ